MAQTNGDSPLDAVSGLERDSSEVGSAGRVIDCLASSISSSSGMTSFIRLWLHTFATSLMSGWRQCKEHAVPHVARCHIWPATQKPPQPHRGCPSPATATPLTSKGLVRVLALDRRTSPGPLQLCSWPCAPGAGNRRFPGGCCSRNWSSSKLQGYSSCDHHRRDMAGQRSGSLRSKAASPGQLAG